MNLPFLRICIAWKVIFPQRITLFPIQKTPRKRATHFTSHRRRKKGQHIFTQTYGFYNSSLFNWLWPSSDRDSLIEDHRPREHSSALRLGVEGGGTWAWFVAWMHHPLHAGWGDFAHFFFAACFSQAALPTYQLASEICRLGSDVESINNEHLRKNYLPKIEARNLCLQNRAVAEARGIFLWNDMVATGLSTVTRLRIWTQMQISLKLIQKEQSTYGMPFCICLPTPTKPEVET